ncbi:MAG: hypothetical protein AAGJ82_07450 [Bacteroidota bacterium]
MDTNQNPLPIPSPDIKPLTPEEMAELEGGLGIVVDDLAGF